MVRKLAGLVAAASMGWVCSAHALGLGAIEIKSYLNEPLKATIPVSSGSEREVESLTVELAGNIDFERAGIERAEYLSTLKFEIRDRVIHISSNKPAREPFIAILLDVRWGSGRLLREYTVLLDPPSMARQAPAPKPMPKPVVVEEGPTRMPPGEPVEATPVKPAAADTTPAQQPAAAKPEPAKPAAAPEEKPAPRAPAEPQPRAGEPGTYGPVAAKETLWSIAYRLRPDPQTITMDQMQVAIFRANPNAFDDGRITGLMKGSVPRIPDTSEIQAVDVQEARMMMAAARTGKAPTAPKPQPKPAPAAAAAPTPEPSKPAPQPAKPAAATVAPAAAAAPEPQKAEAAPETTPDTAAVAPDRPADAKPAAAGAMTDEAETAPAETAEAPVAEEAMVEEPAPPGAMVDEETEEPVEEAAQPAAPIETTPVPAAQPEPAVEQPGLLDELLERLGALVEEPLFLPAMGGLILLIGLIFGVRAISNKMAQRAYAKASRKPVPKAVFAAPVVESEGGAAKSTREVLEESGEDEDTGVVKRAGSPPGAEATQAMMADTLAQTQAQTLAQTAAPAVGETQAGDAEPAVPEAQGGGGKVDFDVTGNFATDTVQINLDAGDPLSEAEFHRAYGLYDEAALLLKQALEKDPSRNDARVKLAEIYFEASKAPEFLETARELKGKVPGDQWQQVALMGSQIAPDDELFKGAGDVGVGGTVDLSFDEPAAPAAAPTAAAAPQAEEPKGDDSVLDFKLEDIEMPATAADAPAGGEAPAADAGGGIEFDLGDLGVSEEVAPGAPAEPAAPISADAGTPEKPEGLDLEGFDLDLGGDAAPEAPPAEPSEELPSLEADAAEPSEAVDLSAGGESFDLGGDLGEISIDDGAAEDAGDEASTKLDLARAYMDMGDNDMAKSLLNEVLQQGNDAQKKEAQELLQRVPA